MRKAWLLLLLVPSAFVYACSGDDNNNTDGGTDATANDAAADTSNNDTGTQDTGTQDTGAQDAGMDVTLTLDCFKPADCVDGGSPDAAYPPADAGVVCCGSVLGNGNQNACQIEGASTTCKAPSACATDFSGLLACSTATVRFCTTDAECTEQNANPLKSGSSCCTASAGDAGTFHVCANSTVAAGSGGKITCP